MPLQKLSVAPTAPVDGGVRTGAWAAPIKGCPSRGRNTTWLLLLRGGMRRQADKPGFAAIAMQRFVPVPPDTSRGRTGSRRILWLCIRHSV